MIEATQYDNGNIRVTDFDEVDFHLSFEYEKDEFRKILSKGQRQKLESANTIFLNRKQYATWIY